MKLPNRSSLWLVALGLLIPAVAARAARLAAGAGYTAITHEDPPKNPEHPQVEWKEAIAWTIFSGAIGGLAQLVARRWLAGRSLPAEGYNLRRRLKRSL